MRTVAVFLLALCLVAASACGGNGDGAAKARSAKRVIQAEAQGRAEAMVLELSDLPDGWRASPHEEDTAGGDRLRECLGVDYSALTIIGEADSRDFAVEDSTEASSSATVFADEAGADEASSGLSDGMESDAAEDCFRDLIEKMANDEGPQFKVVAVDIGELGVTAPSSVEETKAWQIAISFDVTSGEAKGSSVTAYVDFVALREGDSIAVLQMSDVQTPFDSELRNELVQAVADRMSEGSVLSARS